MALFQSILTLLLLAILSLQVSRRLRIPYPTMLAILGFGVAMLPWAPATSIDPHLALALFIAPAILDAAFDFPLRALRLHWLPLFALAVVAVLLTTAAVAWVGVAYTNLPVAAAVVLGAIVAPPDAAAAAAMLDQPSLPRATVTVLKGESLLNDAVALFVFSVALHISNTAGHTAPRVMAQLALAIPGGLLLGIVAGRIVVLVVPFLFGTMGGILFQFVATFGIWILAEHLKLSAIIAVVAAAMTIARHTDRQPARDRIQSDAVWNVVVFVLNILAFLFVGLQARAIALALDPAQLHHAITFAALVLATVVGVRAAWVMAYNRLIQPVYRKLGYGKGPTLKQGIVASWCGMRGMVTLAAALALPESFPQRGLVVLSALAVVLGTLVVQGITLEPLIRLLRFPSNASTDNKLERARELLIEAARTALESHTGKAAEVLGNELDLQDALDTLRLSTLRVQRAQLWSMRNDDAIDEDIFHSLEKELDLSEIASERRKPFNLSEG